MKIFIEWVIVSVVLSAILYLLVSFAALSFSWFLVVDAGARLFYGIFQIIILLGSYPFVVDMNKKG